MDIPKPSLFSQFRDLPGSGPDHPGHNYLFSIACNLYNTASSSFFYAQCILWISSKIYLFTLPSKLCFPMCLRHSSGQNSYHSINICGLIRRSEISPLPSSKRTILINSISKASLHLITTTSQSFYSKLQLSHPSLSAPPPFSLFWTRVCCFWLDGILHKSLSSSPSKST